MTNAKQPDYTSDWSRACAAVKVKGALPLTFYLIPARQSWLIQIAVRTTVPDVDTGKEIPLHGVESVDRSTRPYIEFFHSLARRLYNHELDENLMVRDEYVFDPHEINQGLGVPATRPLADCEKEYWYDKT